MADRENVINGLECCKYENKLYCDQCPYDYNGRGNERYECTAELSADALALLKEQEAKTGHWIDSAGADKCSVCGATYSDLYPDYQHTHYCPNCGAEMIGQAVKWDV